MNLVLENIEWLEEFNLWIKKIRLLIRKLKSVAPISLFFKTQFFFQNITKLRRQNALTFLRKPRGGPI